DTRMNANVETVLGGYKDPRRAELVQPGTDPEVRGQFKGIRTGIDIDAKSRYDNYSKLLPQPNRMQLMVASESWFLKAEAALRGWRNAGDAKTNYETGIERSFEMYGLSAQAVAYKNNATDKPIPYIDPKANKARQNDLQLCSPY